MKNKRGEEMPGVTVDNVDDICATLTHLCNWDTPKVGGVSFIPDTDEKVIAEHGPGVKCLIYGGIGIMSFRMTTEQVHHCLETLQETMRSWKGGIEKRFEDFAGMGPLMSPPPGTLVKVDNMKKFIRDDKQSHVPSPNAGGCHND